MRVSQKEWQATQNRLEYLKDKADRQDKELQKNREGMLQLQEAAGIIVKKVALLYGGEGKTILLPAKVDLDSWQEEITREENGDLVIHLKKKEK